MPQQTSSALDLAREHLGHVENIYLTVRRARSQAEAHGTPAQSARENVRLLSHAYIHAKKARLPHGTRLLHEKSHAARMDLEKVWAEELGRQSDRLFEALDFDTAYTLSQRGWITPPREPVDGVLVDGSTRKWRNRVRKALTPPKPGDMQAVEAWDMGDAARSQLETTEEGQSVLVLRDDGGNPMGVATVSRTEGALHIDYLSTAPGHEFGTQMMQGLARIAAKEGLDLHLSPAYGTDPFFKGLGMSSTGGGGLGFTAEQAGAFARSGGFMPPPSTSAGTAGGADQQLAVNVLQNLATLGGAGEPITMESVRDALAATMSEASFSEGAVQTYLGLAMQTASAAGQVSLEHLGLGKTWSWATPRTVANDTFGVRGSKVVEGMYRNHLDKLTKIITEATDPRHPKNLAQVKAAIKQEWPNLRRYEVERIARTETGAVWMQTAANAYEANGISEFESIVATVAIGVDSAGACDYCVEASASVHDITSNLPPWHPNCRCDIIPVLEDPDTGEPWLPPDEPWTGGGDGSGPPAVPPSPMPPPSETPPRPEPSPEKPSPPEPPTPEPTPAPEPPSAPEPAPAPTEATKSPADVTNIRLRDPEERATVERALTTMGKVIRMPDNSPTVDVVRGTGSSTFAAHKKVPTINGSYQGNYAESTLVHEFAHYMDWTLGGADPDTMFAGFVRTAVTRMKTQREADVAKLIDALARTPEYRTLRDTNNRFARYLRRGDEMFARSFEQYIGTKTGDEAILGKIAATRRAENEAKYWSEESFKPVEQAWDEFLSGRGMLLDPVETPDVPAPKPQVEPDKHRMHWNVPESTNEPFGITANGLTNDELWAIGKYVGSGTNGSYQVVNRWLRKLLVKRGKNLEEIKTNIALLDSAIAKAPALEQPLTLYRGVAGTEFYGVPKVGQVLEDPAFLSTSTTQELPTSWSGTHGDLWTIEAPAGTKGVNVNEALSGTVYGPKGLDPATAKEREVILARGQRLVVDDVQERVTVYPNGNRVVSHDVKAHIEPEPVKAPTPPPAPVATPRPAPEPSPAPVHKPSVAATDITTREGFESVLAHYEGQQIRVTFDFGPSYRPKKVMGLVSQSKTGKWLVGNGNIYTSFDKIAGLEVRIGGKYRDFREVEQKGGVEALAPKPKPKPGTEKPAGGWTFPDAPPSGRMGDYPPTPQFKSVEEAQAFAEQFLAREVYLGANPDLKGVQEALDAMASVMRPYGVKVDRIHVERDPKAKALAYYGHGGTRKLTIDGKLQRWEGEILRFQAQAFSASKAKASASNIDVFDRNKAYEIRRFQEWIDKAEERGTPAEQVAQYQARIDNLNAASRWWVASENGGTTATRAFSAHEAAHALSYHFGQALVDARPEEEGLARVFAQRLEAHGVTETERWSVSQYGATGENPHQPRGSELWAEVTAARISGVWDIVPKAIQDAYEETLDTITPEMVKQKVADMAEKQREAQAARAAAIQKERTASLRRRAGLH